jgi:hypothetical protein
VKRPRSDDPIPTPKIIAEVVEGTRSFRERESSVSFRYGEI